MTQGSKTLGDLRCSRGLSQASVGHHMGVTQVSVSHLERGRSRMRRTTAERFAAAMCALAPTNPVTVDEVLAAAAIGHAGADMRVKGSR